MPTVNKPDFFIVGAPKCGTTALYAYLGGHPDIGMSKRQRAPFFRSRYFRRPETIKNAGAIFEQF